MSYYGSQPEAISTVQLSPFAEDHWQRIVTYSPIYVHWTDMLMMKAPHHQQRPHTSHVRNLSRKLSVRDRIDVNTLKLEDEILLNELHDMRISATAPGPPLVRGKLNSAASKVINDAQQTAVGSPIDDYLASSSSFFQQSAEVFKHRGSQQTESSLIHPPPSSRCPVSSSQSVSRPVISVGQIQKLSPNVGLGPQPPAALGVQLRRSAITRDRVLSAAYDQRSASPLSLSSTKRTISTAQSGPRNPAHRTSHTPFSTQIHDTKPTVSLHEQLTGESLSAFKKPRAKSSTSSRSAMHMLKTKNERYRQKQQCELKTLLVEPWKQPSWTDGTLEEAIPNSIDLMHRMCGPATPFERNLRQKYHQQLHQYRNGTQQSSEFS